MLLEWRNRNSVLFYDNHNIIRLFCSIIGDGTPDGSDCRKTARRYEAVTRYSASIGISAPYFTYNMYVAVS
jgi:hypothetical protein